MIKIGDYSTIMSDRNIFNQIVYTHLSEALRLLDERRRDPVLVAKVEKLLNGDIPLIMRERKCGVFGRQIATPNNESRRFISIAKDNDLFPVFFEYYEDKFSSRNEFKHSLGQLHILQKVGKKNESVVERITIMDFNKHGSKKLGEVKTLWDEPLVEFHRKLFIAHDYDMQGLNFFEASDWYRNNGEKPANFYINLFMLFICNGILFENFLTSKNLEGDFTEKIVLPAMEKVLNLIGVKPLIVPLEPLDLETENFWYHHTPKVKELIPNYKKK